MCYLLQAGDFRSLGQYAAMAIVQTEMGFPFLEEAVFEYIAKGKSTGVSVPISNLPEGLKVVVQNVSATVLLAMLLLHYVCAVNAFI